jgi:ATPase subunit of ABC transporter with duplicated ATPase domains
MGDAVKIDLHVESPVSTSARAQQLESAFDVPHRPATERSWNIDLPVDGKRDWNVGLIVGPSGAGKTQILSAAFGKEHKLKWGAASVVDDFADDLGMDDISAVCQAVGFNTIPAWLRPYKVLSNGEQFR